MKMEVDSMQNMTNTFKSGQDRTELGKVWHNCAFISVILYR